MEINVFLLCYNESVLLPHTINHYKKYMPSCKITIYDNESTDNSVEIAKSYGCEVISWSSNDMIDDYKYKDIKNNNWKHIQSGWIIMADMDEFLCISENELLYEINQGTTILQVQGRDMIGESNTLDLSDIDLQEIKKYQENSSENKDLCFLRDKIINIFYSCGAHVCNPTGEIRYSSKKYINKHMNYLGLEFSIDKIMRRYERSSLMRSKGMATHYINDIEEIRKKYETLLENCSTN
jgi:glycosyltransferase involved in cell wall biosynthesis